MKIIDLLNKIANGEEVIYSFKDGYRTYENINLTDALLNYLDVNYDVTEDDTSWLNDEVEIIEEEKKIPEKLDFTFEDGFIKKHFKSGAINYLPTFEAIKQLYNKQCEIIDYLKSKGE